MKRCPSQFWHIFTVLDQKCLSLRNPRQRHDNLGRQKTRAWQIYAKLKKRKFKINLKSQKIYSSRIARFNNNCSDVFRNIRKLDFCCEQKENLSCKTGDKLRIINPRPKSAGLCKEEPVGVGWFSLELPQTPTNILQ